MSAVFTAHDPAAHDSTSQNLCAHEHYAHWLRLVLTPGLGPARIYALLRRFGIPEQVLSASHEDLAQVLDEALAKRLRDNDDARESAIALNLAWLKRRNHHLLALGDAQYPEMLLHLNDPPPLLWAIGDLGLLRRPALAIVGSRHATRGGVEHARAFAQALGDAGWTILSGMARGIDAAAHQGGLRSAASTIAVLAHGLENIYPASNRALGLAVAGRGLILSEFALGTLPLRSNFPRRNRLIAALGEGVLVVEAAQQSGSLITARLAAELGRDVFAVPGSIDSPLAKGCHYLIKQGAKLVECADDILSELAPAINRAAQTTGQTRTWAGSTPTADADPIAIAAETTSATEAEAEDSTHIASTPAALAVLNALGWDPASVDQLSARHDLSVANLNAQLVILELYGSVERLSDGRYRRLKSSSVSAPRLG